MHIRDITPMDALRLPTRIVMTGREELLLEGHAGLFSYETGCIRVRTGAGLLQVTGRDLTIDYFGTQDLLIRGRLDGAEYSGDEG